MPIPDFQTLMRPTLELHPEARDLERAPLRDALAEYFNVSDGERAEMLESGGQRRFDNRVAWTLTHLAQAGLLSRPKRGITRITDRGLKVLAECPDRVDMTVLNRFPEYLEFRKRNSASGDAANTPVVEVESRTPEEVIQAVFRRI